MCFFSPNSTSATSKAFTSFHQTRHPPKAKSSHIKVTEFYDTLYLAAVAPVISHHGASRAFQFLGSTANAHQSALFNFEALILVLLLAICTSAYVHQIFPRILDANKDGFVARIRDLGLLLISSQYSGHLLEVCEDR